MPYGAEKRLRIPVLQALRLLDGFLCKSAQLKTNGRQQVTATVRRTQKAAGRRIIRVLPAIAFPGVGSAAISFCRTGRRCSTIRISGAFHPRTTSVTLLDTANYLQRKQAAGEQGERDEYGEELPHRWWKTKAKQVYFINICRTNWRLFRQPVPHCFTTCPRNSDCPLPSGVRTLNT